MSRIAMLALLVLGLLSVAAYAHVEVDTSASAAASAATAVSTSSWTSTLIRYAGIAVALVLVCVTAGFLEKARLRSAAQGLPGPKDLPPFIGGVLQMVSAPTKFWHDAFARGPLSWTALGPKLVVVVSDANAVKSIFTRCSERLPLVLSLNSKPLLGDDNFAFLNGPEHRMLRSSLLPLFTQRCLNMYLEMQVSSVREHLAEWATKTYSESEPLMTRFACLDMNARTSQRAFLGTHLTEEEREQLAADYGLLTGGMFTLPLNVPGTALYAGVQARPRIIALLEKAVRRARALVQDPAYEPVCLLELWMRNLTENPPETGEHGQLKHATDYGCAKVMLDFLFAAQDASTASLTWIAHFVSLHPEVLAKVRAEVDALHTEQIKANGKDAPLDINPDTMVKLKYCAKVVRETLRICPPATIVPHQAGEDIIVETATKPGIPSKCPMSGAVAPAPASAATDAASKCPFAHTIRKGTVVVPSIFAANREGYEDPEKFNPDRFTDEAVKALGHGNATPGDSGTFLTFGAGPHSCMGYRYAQQQLITFLAILAHEYSFERKHTDKMHDIEYAPTIYPSDACPMSSFRLRNQAA